MAVRLMLIFNIFSFTVLSQINGQHTTAVLHPTPTTSIPMDNTSRNATTSIPDSVSKAKVEQNNWQHNGTIGEKLSSTASERSTSSTTTNVTTMPASVSTASATTNVTTMPATVSTSSATTNITMPVSVSTSSATKNITMPVSVSTSSATKNITIPATVSTSSATKNITMPATVSTSSATTNITMPATVSTSSATTNITVPATVSTLATTNITMSTTVSTSSASTNITVSASLATTDVTTVPATVLNIRTESSSVIMKEETSTGSPSSALPVKATPLQTSVKPDVKTEGATSTRTIQNENTSPSMPISGETSEKVRMSTSSTNSLVSTDEPSSSSNNPTPTSQTSGTATSMRPATFPNTSPSQPYASPPEERTTTVTTGTRGAATPKGRPDTNTFPNTTQLTQSVRNDQVMAVVDANGVNATASKMSKESVEEKEDRQLFYIAIGILGGTAVLVLAVAVITYFTHRELPARVDIRKFTSYTSSA
ncbi:uncharacterized protein [Haliotis cracherodii]|uniref:uncharacterized protein isoform X1 n=1 Tax=Haliotis cracherodii TaxID=6455 RepID=UPI0039E9D91A